MVRLVTSELNVRRVLESAGEEATVIPKEQHCKREVRSAGTTTGRHHIVRGPAVSTRPRQPTVQPRWKCSSLGAMTDPLNPTAFVEINVDFWTPLAPKADSEGCQVRGEHDGPVSHVDLGCGRSCVCGCSTTATT